MNESNTYFVTFGQKYRHEPHPLKIHPDGWVEVSAKSEFEAREAIVKACGTQWAFIYSEKEFESIKPLHKLGCLLKLGGINEKVDI